jgi:hypothetical protein
MSIENTAGLITIIYVSIKRFKEALKNENGQRNQNN